MRKPRTCTHFGTSAKYIDALKKAELTPAESHDLSSVRALLSTGSPLVPEAFDYVYAAIKKDLHLASISGGTDIVGCFVLGIPTKPVWRGEIQGPGLGLAVDVVDETGKPVKGGKGELVCLKPFPSMPIGFWNDPDGKKYNAAYFQRFENVWHHGDFAEWTEHGGIVIHGRSDATLNPGGVRIGTAEIYRQVEQLPEVQESVVIGQDWDNDVRVVLFVVLKPGATPRRCPARAHQEADPGGRQPAPRAGEDHPGRRHPAQQVRQGFRARRARRRAWPRHQELGRAGQPGGARHLSQHGRAGALGHAVIPALVAGIQHLSLLRRSRTDGSR